MFEPPPKNDIDRALSSLAHEARNELLVARDEVTANAAKAGALQSNRLILNIADASEKIHIKAMAQATSTLRYFVQRMDITPWQIGEWARPHQMAFKPPTNA